MRERVGGAGYRTDMALTPVQERTLVDLMGSRDERPIFDPGLAERLRSELEERVAAGRLDLRGRRVLTDAGFDLGELVDVEFDEATGTIERLETARSRIRGAGLLSIGPYAVIVSQAAVGTPDDTEAS